MKLFNSSTWKIHFALHDAQPVEECLSESILYPKLGYYKHTPNLSTVGAWIVTHACWYQKGCTYHEGRYR